jgi:hypothetical protein
VRKNHPRMPRCILPVCAHKNDIPAAQLHSDSPNVLARR